MTTKDNIKSKNKKPIKKKVGRPRIIINWEEVDNFLIAGCSGAEIAGYLGINKHTVYEKCESEKKMSFSEYSTQKRAKGDSMLRARQYQEAMDGDKTMLVWLGKNRLRQTDKQAIEVTTDKRKTIDDFFPSEEELIDGIED